MKYLSLVVFILLLGFSGLVLAQNKVVVIPLWGAADTNHRINNVVTVAKKNGDFTNVIAAMDSITDASRDNPYLLAIGPGVYVLEDTLRLKANVTVTGAGEDLTKLTINKKEVPVLKAAGDSLGREKVQHITVENASRGLVCIAVLGNTGTSNFEYVTAIARGCSSGNAAFTFLEGGSFSHVTAIAGGGQRAVGILIDLGIFKFDDVNIQASNGITETTGLLVGTYIQVANSQISVAARSGNAVYGVKLYGNNLDYAGRATSFTNTDIQASNSSPVGQAVALLFENDESYNQPSISVRRSTLIGGTHSLLTSEYTDTVVSQSTLIGDTSADDYFGSKSCVATDSGNGLLIPADCTELTPPSD